VSIKIEDPDKKKGKKLFLIGIAMMAIAFCFGPVGIFSLGIIGLVVTTFGLFVWTSKEIDLSAGG
jgi:hypothetical protein